MDRTALRWPQSATDSDADADGLRPLDWDGLCARLAAAQQLRRSLAQVRGGAAVPGKASFAPRAARLVARAARAAPDVNLEPLADGKARGGMAEPAGEATSAPDSRDRGQQ